MRYLAFTLVFATCAVAGLAVVPSMQRRDAEGAVHVAGRVLLVGATLGVLAATLLGTSATSRNLNLVPGAGIAEAIETSDRGAGMTGLQNVVGNVALFVPLGFLAVIALRQSTLAVTILGAALSLLIEVSQFLLGRRWADVDDLLLNTAGAGVGALAATVSVAAIRRLRLSRAARGS